MKDLRPILSAEERARQKVQRSREVAESRFPLVFGVLATFGLVATLYGFEKLIDRSEWLSNNPWVLLAVGLTTLMATGAAYRKLN